ncbi:hypothetical protein GCM10025867_49080 (plasmid) [Frondihabitans sucicola]|uniref:Uncharacterized protein n=1 Tax=Frondihabitans sucicola TaxID=1268041 RepID=A0ABN6Y950_9MICO|nr:hypothetical protein [Frondihabitans sucicola]BDZ52667.1 hypothetical protein GCM10025867_49080 [Frondihabitans sucicola]
MTDKAAAEAAMRVLVTDLRTEMGDWPWTSATDHVVITSAGGWTTTSDDRPKEARAGFGRGRIRYDAWKTIREAMTDPERGAWLYANVTITPDGEHEFFFEWDRRPSIYDYDDDIFTAKPKSAQVSPLDYEWLWDLKEHPRTPEHQPEWMKRMLAKDARKRNPANMPRTKKAIKAEVAWPEELAPLAGDLLWAEVWTAISDYMVARLKTGAYPRLANKDERDSWGAEADGLVQDVFGDVSGVFVEGQPLAALAGLWRDWSQLVSHTPEPEGLAGVDLSATAVYSEASGPTQKLFDDFGDTVGTLIDSQVFQRFGVRPEA